MDYTTLEKVKAYGDVKTAGGDALVTALIPAVSRALDRYCHQRFGAETVTGELLPALIDAQGTLLCWPAVPTVSAITAAAWRLLQPGATWQTLAVGDLEIAAALSGCTVRAMDVERSAYRGARLQVRLSYAGGWANQADVPADFEWYTRRVCYWEYKKREAPMEKTAMPQLGVVIIPQSWPPDIRQGFAPFVRSVPV